MLSYASDVYTFCAVLKHSFKGQVMNILGFKSNLNFFLKCRTGSKNVCRKVGVKMAWGRQDLPPPHPPSNLF